MCGIAGIYNAGKTEEVNVGNIIKMVGMLEHRGPDEKGIYLDDNIALGHTRLSIVDLSSGTQPIHNEDKSLWIIYNGEIYNYPELRNQLQENGHRFYTATDTEVLLHLYEQYGTDCLEQVNGQFAMAIWDTRKKELFLVRDRIGIRPIYYTIRDHNIIFASEIKSIFANPQVSRRIDPVAMDQIFTFWTTLAQRTIFKDIYELPPGHYMKVSGGKVLIRKYWNIPYYPRSEQTNMSPQEICEHLRRLLLDAVKIRLRADVPVGCYLSGGLDSSAITSMVVRNYNRDVRTFGIRFEQTDFDEGEHQSRMVSWLGANHSDILVTNENIGFTLPYCVWHCEKPLLRTAPVPLYLLSELVAQNDLKVVLTGEGADEVFGGYNIFREAKIRRFWSRYPNSKKRAELISRLYPYIFSQRRFKQALQHFFARGIDDISNPLFSHIIRWSNTSRIKTFFSAELRDEIGNYDGYKELVGSLPCNYSSWDYLSKAQYLETAVFLSNYLLSSQGDRMAMAHSVEIRLPYLDPRVMEFMARVPAKWKIMGLNEKYILKKTFENILPKEITMREKHPYRAPIKESLLNAKTAEYTKQMLSETMLKKTGLFDSQKVSKLLHKIQTAEHPSEVDSMALVGILSSQLVYEQFIGNFAVPNVAAPAVSLMIDRRKKSCQYVG